MPRGIDGAKCLCYNRDMEIAQALRSSMKSSGMRDEHVAIAVNASAQSVSAWRLGRKIPRGDTMQLLRRAVPGFAERLDSEVARAS